MQLLLDSRPKTVPSNYEVKGMELYEEGPPGFSITDDQLAKAKRMEDPHYDWWSYQQSASNPLFDHPNLANREHDRGLAMGWNDLLKELEPFNSRRV